jgi:hypothetical protein
VTCNEFGLVVLAGTGTTLDRVVWEERPVLHPDAAKATTRLPNRAARARTGRRECVRVGSVVIRT